MAEDPRFYDGELAHYYDRIRDGLDVAGMGNDVAMVAARAQYAGEVLRDIRVFTGCSVGEERQELRSYLRLMRPKDAGKFEDSDG